MARLNSELTGSAIARPLIGFLACILLVGGITLSGQGLWIYVKAFTAQILLERAFAQSVTSGTPVKPWNWADTWPIARIEVPRINASAIALKGTSGQALAFGPGHLDNTPAPGEYGTAVYAAHRDTHFAFLKNVEKNDLIRITRHDGQVVTYRVTYMEVVRWDRSSIDPRAEGRHLVLATCYPFGALTSGPLRYLVHAEMF